MAWRKQDDAVKLEIFIWFPSKHKERHVLCSCLSPSLIWNVYHAWVVVLGEAVKTLKCRKIMSDQSIIQSLPQSTEILFASKKIKKEIWLSVEKFLRCIYGMALLTATQIESITSGGWDRLYRLYRGMWLSSLLINLAPHTFRPFSFLVPRKRWLLDSSMNIGNLYSCLIDDMEPCNLLAFVLLLRMSLSNLACNDVIT